MTQPSDAGFTFLMYLKSVPRVAFSGGGVKRCAAPRQLGRVHRQVHHVLLGVDGDDVAVAHQRDGSAVLRLGRHVADDEAVGAAGEAAVGEERHVLAEARAHDDGGGRQHLRHAGPALRALVADHDHAALADLAALDGVRACPPRSRRPGRGPENDRPSLPVIFATAPSGARLP